MKLFLHWLCIALLVGNATIFHGMNPPESHDTPVIVTQTNGTVTLEKTYKVQENGQKKFVTVVVNQIMRDISHPFFGNTQLPAYCASRYDLSDKTRKIVFYKEPYEVWTSLLNQYNTQELHKKLQEKEHQKNKNKELASS